MKMAVLKMRVKKVKPLAKVRFETALGWLRRGYRIRRRAWMGDSYLCRVKESIFVMWPRRPGEPFFHPHPWKPYPEDLLSTDWEKAK
jgi:hypothetical protein